MSWVRRLQENPEEGKAHSKPLPHAEALNLLPLPLTACYSPLQLLPEVLGAILRKH